MSSLEEIGRIVHKLVECIDETSDDGVREILRQALRETCKHFARGEDLSDERMHLRAIDNGTRAPEDRRAACGSPLGQRTADADAVTCAPCLRVALTGGGPR